jgi:eukaryotic-like serine/threonine-protein kinase
MQIGTRIGAYEVIAKLGEGGMGEVYRARDTKLDRDVAIKILPESFAQDPERLARFAREAKTLAALNHPNIAQVFAVEDSVVTGGAEPGSSRAIVMELVEGPTLADRIAQGRIPIDDALPIARQIADALEAAHDQGIIHRDLKPANIKLRPDGTVKVLDFGLAKALSGEGSSAVATPLSLSPTITSPAGMTGMGVILGTAAYMAPEQARGKPVDRRADIWAFGCVLYEMLTGRQAFEPSTSSGSPRASSRGEGATVADVIAAVLTREPDLAALSDNAPASIRRLLRRCLEKDRKKRLADAADARLEIDEALGKPVSDRPVIPAPAAPMSGRHMALAAAAAILLAATAGYLGWTLKPVTPSPVTRLTIPVDDGVVFTGVNSIALSPDGRRVAYTANGRVYLRGLDQLDAVRIAGNDSPPLASARSPVFSPDGQWVAYWEAGQIRKVSVSGGAPVSVCAVSAPPPSGLDWTAGDTILFGWQARGIWRVPSSGGSPEQLVTLKEGDRAHGPQLLPGGRSILFTLAPTASWDEAEIVVQSLDNGSRKTIVSGGTDGRYLPTGHVIYGLRGTILALPFDVASLSTSGGPTPVVDGVWQPGSPATQLAVSATGTLVYGPPPEVTEALRTLVWVNRQGREEAIPVPPRRYGHPRLAPDGTRLALHYVGDNQNVDVWVWDFARGTWTRITSHPTIDTEPVWTLDGERLIFTSRRTGTIALFSQAANGAGTAEQLSLLSGQSNAAPALSPDGRHLVIRTASQGSSYLTMLDLGDSLRAPTSSSPGVRSTPLLQTEFEEYNAEISPDGKWMAYTSNESGAFEVHVRPFPDVTRGQWQVSNGGGTEPLWSRDGRELFYRGPNHGVMTVAVTPGAAWTAGPPRELFAAPTLMLGPIGNAAVSRTYDVAPDGKRFLMLKTVEPATRSRRAPHLVVVQHWFEELERLVPRN